MAQDSGGRSHSHWAFQPVSARPVPQFEESPHRQWVRNEVDAFILARLHQAGLLPAPQADRRTIIRRLTLDLTGLPPTPHEIREFLEDHREEAYERLVDRLLASPHYGERWGQHWLDVVRFAETEGFEYDRHIAGAWRFRDYVIEAFNRDVPYDQFIRDQLAGDELAPEHVSSLIASGFHRLGPVRRNAGNPDVALSRNEVLTTRTDIIGSAFLGLTLGCARCHDHKFDPISQRDYYCLQAFLAATEEYDIPLATPEQQAEWKARTESVNEQVKQLKEALKSAEGTAKRELELRLEELDSQLPPPLPSIMSTRNCADKPGPIHVLKRGEEDKKLDPVGMCVPELLLDAEVSELPIDTPHPRSLLAGWVTNPAHPLTARVMVNRIWQGHFGSGLVETANDFGVNGQRPSHPELLDWLATRFVEGGWSVKAVHRLIVLSSTYRQSGAAVPGTEQQADVASSATLLRSDRAESVDPNNRLLWRFPLRRLQAEELRDAMLCASGYLERRLTGSSVMVPVDDELVDLLYKRSQWAVTKDASELRRRSLYLIAKRNLRLPFMEVFDQPALQTSCARRESSTHAPQALELLNGRISNDLAGIFADRLAREAGPDVVRQVELAFELATGRAPTAAETKLAVEFLGQHPLREFALAMFSLNAFLYVY